jgi:hypothetical protein
MDLKPMNMSLYLKSKMESDRRISIALEKGISKFKEGSISNIHNVYRGIERTSWYSSCAFDKYKDICNELRTEDHRMYLAIEKVYQHSDILLKIIELYINNILNNFNNENQKNIINKVLSLSVNYATATTTKLAGAYAIAKIITSSANFTSSIRVRISSTSYAAITIIDFYGRVQKAAMSARNLLITNPTYYHVLYNNNLEMLYFIVEPFLSKNKKNNK